MSTSVLHCRATTCSNEDDTLQQEASGETVDANIVDGAVDEMEAAVFVEQLHNCLSKTHTIERGVGRIGEPERKTDGATKLGTECT